MRRSVLLGLAVAAGCGGPPPAPPLGPAGSRWDDGTGQLAEASVRLRLDGAGDDVPDDETLDERYDRRHVDVVSSRVSYGGLGYGGFGYGGSGYGGHGAGAWVGIGYGPPPPQPPAYNAAVVVDAGAIEGSVRWKVGGGVVWPAGCAAVRVARGGAPAGGAVVYLDGVRAGRSQSPLVPIKTGGVAQVTDCAIVPAVQLAGPLPVPLVVENGDRQPARLHHERSGGVTTVELEPGGRARFALERAGESQVRDGVRAPAWIVAQAHPYYTITGDDGRFALDEVPPGNHELVIWYPPMVTSLGPDGPRWSPPTVDRRKLVVARRALVTVDASLTPAR